MKYTSLSRWKAIALACAFAMFGPLVLLGQDDAPGSATPPAAEAPAGEAPAGGAPAGATQDALPKDFDGLLKLWNETRSKMVELRDRFDLTDNTIERDTIRVEFTDLLNKSGDLLDRLRDSALTGLSKENQDSTKLNTLMGILLNDANNDQDDRVLATADTLISMGVPVAKFETAARADRLSVPAREIFEEVLIRQHEAEIDDLPRAKITTNRGVIELELFENEAPNTVANFVSLAKTGFYKGLKFHRVIEGFMAQGGDPAGDGTGGPGYKIPCECRTAESRQHFTGSISMANAGPNTGGSQFFITFTRNASVRRLDGKHTVFGRVISGFEVLDNLMRTAESTGFGEQKIEGAVPDVIESIEIVRDRGHEYSPKKVGDETAPAPEPPTSQPELKPAAETGEGEMQEPKLGSENQPPLTGETKPEDKPEAKPAESPAKKDGDPAAGDPATGGTETPPPETGGGDGSSSDGSSGDGNQLAP